jgi:hypothetical protein
MRIRIGIVGALAAGVLAIGTATPAGAIVPPTSDPYTAVSSSCTTVTIQGGVAQGSTGTGGGAIGTGWSNVGKIQTCVEVTTKGIRALANFIPYPQWKWIQGYFTASLRICGGSVVSSTSQITSLYSQSSTYTYPWLSKPLTRSTQLYYAQVYISTNSTLDDGAGNVWVLSSVHPVIHNAAQIVSSGCVR